MDHKTNNKNLIQDDETLLTLSEALDFLRVSRSTLYRLLETGEITGHKIGNGSNWRFFKSDLRRAIKQATVSNIDA